MLAETEAFRYWAVGEGARVCHEHAYNTVAMTHRGGQQSPVDQDSGQYIDRQVDRQRSEVCSRKEFEGGIGAGLPLMRPLAGVRRHCVLVLCTALGPFLEAELTRGQKL